MHWKKLVKPHNLLTLISYTLTFVEGAVHHSGNPFRNHMHSRNLTAKDDRAGTFDSPNPRNYIWMCRKMKQTYKLTASHLCKKHMACNLEIGVCTLLTPRVCRL